MPTRRPQVTDAREFLEITRDFTDPKDILREAISNALDWRATSITIKVTEDKTRAEEDLVIEVVDNGIGLNEERLEAFFDLGRSTSVADTGTARGSSHIGYKGHGTKTYYNSHLIEVESKTASLTVHARMNEPIQNLMNGNVPEYEYEIQNQTNTSTGTKIRILGYNLSKRKEDFDHDVLKDYILWRTKFGSVEKEFGLMDNARKSLTLQGLGEAFPESISFGHRFGVINSNLTSLRATNPGDWTRYYCKKWVFKDRPIVGHPGKHIDMVFYIEGDEAKRMYNLMITGRGRSTEYGMYKVEDRYGIWVCKDYIPIKQVNEWLGLGKRLETKYHAFVNCQDLRLTANRGDVGNTPPDLLQAIENTVKKIYEENIIDTTDFQDYEDSVELEEQYQTSVQEGKDFERRRKRALQKKVCTYRGTELIEPSLEMGVVALFTTIKTLEPSLFPFRVIDYDTKRGYDALVSGAVTGDLARDSMFFIEFKYALENKFNHAFSHLAAIIVWDCNLCDGNEVVDIENKHREVRVTAASGSGTYTKYMLVSATEQHNIEVFVLKNYLRERLDLTFQSRSGGRRSY